MSDWEQRLKAAEEGADRLQAAEDVAEERFKALHAETQAQGKGDEALSSDEFRSWMATRRATDAAWGEWAMLMDAKAGA
jgi:hypothetical protein